MPEQKLLRDSPEIFFVKLSWKNIHNDFAKFDWFLHLPEPIHFWKGLIIELMKPKFP